MGSSQRGQQSGQSRRVVAITCSYLKRGLVHIGLTAVLQAWASTQGGYARCLGQHALTLSMRAASSRCCRCRCVCFKAISPSKSMWGVGKSASSSNVCRKLFTQANLVCVKVRCSAFCISNWLLVQASSLSVFASSRWSWPTSNARARGWQGALNLLPCIMLLYFLLIYYSAWTQTYI